MQGYHMRFIDVDIMIESAVNIMIIYTKTMTIIKFKA